MTERALILNNCSVETKHNDTTRESIPTQTLLDFSWRSQNRSYVVGKAETKLVASRKIDFTAWIKTISAYIWTFVILAQKIWRFLYIIFRKPTKQLMQYQTVHYYTSTKLSPLSSHLLRYESALVQDFT